MAANGGDQDLLTNGTYKEGVSGSPIAGGIVWADKSIASATGASQVLAAANAARKGIFIKAGAAAVGVNMTGAAAVIGGVGTLTLQPFEWIELTGPDLIAGVLSISIITTATAYVTAFEGT